MSYNQNDPYGQQYPQQNDPYGQQYPQQQNPYAQQYPQQHDPYAQQYPQQHDPYGQQYPQQQYPQQYQQQQYPQQYQHGYSRPGSNSVAMIVSAAICSVLGIFAFFLPFFSHEREIEAISLFKTMTEAPQGVPVMLVILAVLLVAAAAFSFISKMHFGVKIIPAVLAFAIAIYYGLIDKVAFFVSVSGVPADYRQRYIEMIREEVRYVNLDFGGFLLILAMAAYVVTVIVFGVTKKKNTMTYY